MSTDEIEQHIRQKRYIQRYAHDSDSFTDLVPHKDILLPDEDHDIYVPENLRAGSIITCAMDIFIKEDKQVRKHFATGVVLGMSLSPDDLSYTGLYVSPILRTLNYNDNHAFFLTAKDEKQGLVKGFSAPACMPYGKIQFVPMSNRSFNYWNLSLRGHVDETLFAEYLDGAQQYQEDFGKPRVIDAHMIRGQDYTVMASHQGQLQSSAPDIIPDHAFSDLDEETARSYKTADALRRLNAIPGSYVAAFVADLRDMAQKTERRNIALNRMKERLYAISRFDDGASSKGRAARLSELMGKAERKITEKLETGDTLPISRREKYEFVLDLLDQIKNGGPSLQQAFEQSQATKKSIELPSFLWSGRYISVNIPDLLDEDRKGNAFRPLSVWKVWEHKDSGKIMAIEGHPATRGSSDHFNHKMRVNPVYTKSMKPGYLIADCVVRVPFTPGYIQDGLDGAFNELPDDKYQKFAAKREHALSNPEAVTVYGIKNIPDEWVERVLDERPDPVWLEKQYKKGNVGIDDARLDGFRSKQDKMQAKKGKNNKGVDQAIEFDAPEI